MRPFYYSVRPNNLLPLEDRWVATCFDYFKASLLLPRFNSKWLATSTSTVVIDPMLCFANAVLAGKRLKPITIPNIFTNVYECACFKEIEVISQRAPEGAHESFPVMIPFLDLDQGIYFFGDFLGDGKSSNKAL